MADYSIGPRIAITGEKEFNDSIKRIDQNYKTLSSEMQAVTSQFDKNDRSQQSLSAQNAVLSKSIDNQKEKISLLNAQYDKQNNKLSDLAAELKKASSEFGENSTQAAKAQNAYNNQSNTLSKLQESINKATSNLNQMERELDGNNTAIKNVKRGYDDAGNKLDEFGNIVEDAGDKSRTFSDVLKANLLSQAIISGIKQLAQAAKDMAIGFVESAASVKAETSQFTQAFGDMADEAEAAIDRVADASGILPTRLNTVGVSIYSFARSSGASVSDAMSLMETALQAAADGAAYYDKSLEDTSESLMSFLKGNYANDAALGVSATETTRNAKAMELFGEKYNDLSEIQKQQTLLKMVTDAQELSGAMGQASREADGWENVTGNLSETWRQFQALVGAPLLENLVPVIKEITEGFKEWMKSIDTEKIAKNVTDFFNFVKDNSGNIIAGIAGIGAAFVSWNVTSIVTGAISAFKKFKAAQEGATVAQWLLNTAMSANPIGIVIAAVAALVTALIYLWNTNEGFRTAIINAWEAIKTTVGNVATAIKNFFVKTIPEVFSSVINWIKENWQGLLLLIVNPFAGAFKLLYDNCEGFRTFIGNFIDGIVSFFNELPGKIGYAIGAVIATFINWAVSVKDWVITNVPLIIETIITFFRELPGKIGTFLVEAISAVIKWTADLINTAKTEIPKFISKVIEFFGELPGKMLDIGKNIVKGIWEGIKSMVSWIGDKISDFCSGLVDGFTDFLGIHSPSRLMETLVGKNMALGIGEGFENTMRRVAGQMQAAIPTAFSGPAATSGPYSGATGTAKSVYNNNTVQIYSPKALNRYETVRQVRNTMQAVYSGVI